MEHDAHMVAYELTRATILANSGVYLAAVWFAESGLGRMINHVRPKD